MCFSCSKDDDGDNCQRPENLNTYSVTENSIGLQWYVSTGSEGEDRGATGNSDVLSFDVEYGLAGFDLGTGTRVTTSNFNYEVSNLEPSTQYDAYVRSNCSGSSSSSFFGPVSFTTEEACRTPGNPSLYGSSYLRSCSFRIDWFSNGETAWQIEYGEVGFALGDGTTINTSDTDEWLTNLLPSTTYEVYVRANCGSDGYSGYTDALVVTTEPLGYPYVGDWTIQMYDSYGDGWQGDGIKITLNDNVSYAAIPEGTNQFSNTATINVPNNTTELIFEFTGDDYPQEVSYEIYAPNGNLIYSDSTPSVGVFLTLSDICDN